MLITCFNPFPVLSTKRLTLRQLELADAPAIFEHRNDDKVNTHLEDFRHASIEQTRAFITRVNKEIDENKTILWVITENGNNKFLGTICFWNILREEAKAETGYTLDPAVQGKGYMHEAMQKILEYGFNVMKLKTVDAYTKYTNEGSIKLLKKNNFVQTTPQKPVSGDRICFCLARKK